LIRFLQTLAGVIPLIMLCFRDWLSVGSSSLGSDPVNVKMLDMVMSPIVTRDVISAAIDGSLTGSDYSEQLMLQFAGFSEVFIVIAMMFAASILLAFCTMLTCVFTTLRSSLGYFAFGLSMATPLVLFGTILSVNHLFEDTLIEPARFELLERIPLLNIFSPIHLAILASFVALIYCVHFPLLTDDTHRRSTKSTRAITYFAPVKGEGVREGARKILFTAATCCFLFFGTEVAITEYDKWVGDRIKSEYDLPPESDVDIEHPDFDELPRDPELPPRFHLESWRANNDTIGYIRIGDTPIRYPVVQAADNNFYLGHNFEGERSRGGWIFAEHRNRFEGRNISQNTVLFGHSGASRNAYFTLIPQYFETAVTRGNTLSFYRENPIIEFNTLYERMQWKVFAVVLFNTIPSQGEVVDYWTSAVHDFTEDEFHEFIIDIMDRSVLHTTADIQYGDHILTLSTCYFPFGRPAQTRSVVFARRLRPGETANSFDVDAATFNSQAYYGNFKLAADKWQAGQRGVWDRERYLTSYR
jgi:sortase B